MEETLPWQFMHEDWEEGNEVPQASCPVGMNVYIYISMYYFSMNLRNPENDEAPLLGAQRTRRPWRNLQKPREAFEGSAACVKRGVIKIEVIEASWKLKKRRGRRLQVEENSSHSAGWTIWGGPPGHRRWDFLEVTASELGPSSLGWWDETFLSKAAEKSCFSFNYQPFERKQCNYSVYTVCKEVWGVWFCLCWGHKAFFTNSTQVC